MRLNANWLWVALLVLTILALYSENVFGQEIPHPSNLCEYQWVFQPDLLPDVTDPNLVMEVIKHGGFTYYFYIDKRTNKVKLIIATHINLITGKRSENWTWQDHDLIITTIPKLKWNFCLIKMKKIKGQNLDLTNFKNTMLKEQK